MVTPPQFRRLSRHVAFLRITFGVIWLIDASMKWRSTFPANFIATLKSASEGQPGWLRFWFHFWVPHLIAHAHLFATFTAVAETLIALALLCGFARKITYLSAAAFSLLIWAIAEGFGGPYTPTSTDIGTGIIYAIVFLSLYGLDELSGKSTWTLDNYIAGKIKWWPKIANP